MPDVPYEPPRNSWRLARVIDVITQHEGINVVVMIGDQIIQLDWPTEPPSLGDILLAEPRDAPQLWTKLGEAATGGWGSTTDALRWRLPQDGKQSRMTRLWQRHAIRRVIRQYFDEDGFIEIETPLLVHGTTPDIAIESFQIEDRYLITSSEYQIKRMEVGGFEKIYTFTKNFRRGDDSNSFRNPEFTMLEWARCHERMEEIERDAENFICRAHKLLGGTGILNVNGASVDLKAPWDRMSVQSAIERVTGVPLPDFSEASVAAALAATGIVVQDSWFADIHFLFSTLMSVVQPSLGRNRPVFLQDWPAFETSSAAVGSTANTCRRSELFIGGIELSDGFSALTEHTRQLESFDRQSERRREMGLPTVALDDAYLRALRAGLPPSAGMALGFDRLIMVLTGSTSIREVLAFAWSES